jgi:hypothetical protein
MGDPDLDDVLHRLQELKGENPRVYALFLEELDGYVQAITVRLSNLAEFMGMGGDHQM